MQHSKSSVSLMFCGNALGEYLPPMVVYRAQNIYTEWTRGGPTGCIYECTKSGWFDSRCFERWFREIFLPHANAKDGKKVLLGDNLASHFTPEVIQAAVDNNIEFVCLIPNSTHILQPLDVAVFRSVKVEWRRIMEAWRKEARIKGSIPKSQFPGLLRKLESRLKSENLIAGFRATGIWPLDRDEVLKRLPGTNQDIGGTAVHEVFNDAVIDILQKHCGPSTSGVSRARGKKIQVTPGRRITPAQLKGSSSHDATTTGTGADGSDGAGTVAVTDARNEEVQSSSSEDEDVSNENSVESSSDEPQSPKNSVQCGQWVVVKYPEKRRVFYFAGQVLEVNEDGVKVSFVRQQPGSVNLFRYPETEDVEVVERDDIVDTLEEPLPMNSRQLFTIDYSKYKL